MNYPVDLVSAGETHSICGNSQKGLIYFWGKIKDYNQVLCLEKSPLLVENYIFKRKGIKSIKSGMNHILILSGKTVYCFGDKTRGALGNTFLRDDNVP